MSVELSRAPDSTVSVCDGGAPFGSDLDRALHWFEVGGHRVDAMAHEFERAWIGKQTVATYGWRVVVLTLTPSVTLHLALPPHSGTSCCRTEESP